jgi:cation diffusion facilitator CzcD-associated flavoprotein CzcO
LSDYQGHLRHSSNWDDAFDPIGKRIAVIGNGASGVQLVPSCRKSAKESITTPGVKRGFRRPGQEQQHVAWSH